MRALQRNALRVEDSVGGLDLRARGQRGATVAPADPLRCGESFLDVAVEGTCARTRGLACAPASGARLVTALPPSSSSSGCSSFLGASLVCPLLFLPSRPVTDFPPLLDFQRRRPAHDEYGRVLSGLCHRVGG